jgi:hypothetical protein
VFSFARGGRLCLRASPRAKRAGLGGEAGSVCRTTAQPYDPLPSPPRVCQLCSPNPSHLSPRPPCASRRRQRKPLRHPGGSRRGLCSSGIAKSYGGSEPTPVPQPAGESRMLGAARSSVAKAPEFPFAAVQEASTRPHQNHKLSRCDIAAPIRLHQACGTRLPLALTGRGTRPFAVTGAAARTRESRHSRLGLASHGCDPTTVDRVVTG